MNSFFFFSYIISNKALTSWVSFNKWWWYITREREREREYILNVSIIKIEIIYIGYLHHQNVKLLLLCQKY